MTNDEIIPPEIPPRPSVDEIIGWNRLDEVNSTDTGNAKRFVRLFGDVVRYVPDNNMWYVWSGTHWEPDVVGKTFALTAAVVRDIRASALELDDEPGDGGGLSPRQRLLAHAIRTESESARRKILLVAPEDPSIVKRVEELDVDLDSIAAMNGCVNLNTGELTENEPKHMATSCVRVAYDPDATSPELDRYLETFIPDKTDQDVVFAILGTALRGGNACRMLPIFLGHTTSGKSQLLAALTRLLGGYATAINVSVFRGNLDDKPRPDLVKAMFTRLAYATEASKSWELHADQVKRLTGGDSIPYRNLYSQGVEATPRFTPLIVTNDMPRVKGADAAFKRRMIVVRFDRTIATQDEDPLIKERFVRDERCLQAILARMVAGARSPLFRHGIKWNDIPQRFASDTMECFDELDHIGEFLSWMIEHGHLVEVESPSVVPRSHCAKASNLHAWYMMWIKRHGDKIDKADALNMRDFGMQLRSRGWTSSMAMGTRWVGWKLVSEITWL